MKITLIIYGVSWFILFLSLIVSKFGEGKTNTFKSDVSWATYIAAFILAPLLVLFLPYLKIESYRNEKKSRRIRKEREEEQNRIAERRRLSLEKYQDSKLRNSSLICPDILTITNKIKILAKQKKYASFLSVLSKLTLPPETFLKVEEAKQEGRGDRSRLYVVQKGIPDADIWKYIRVDNSTIGAWEVYLLHIIWHTLPLFWHENYNKRSYLFSQKDCDDITFIRETDSEDISDMLRHYDLTPEIIKDGNFYYISSCYWSNWGGLKKELVQITFKENQVVDIFITDTKTLYQYDCGIRF